MTTLPRDVLVRAFNGDQRAIAAFEEMDAYLSAKAGEVTSLLAQAESAASRLGTLEAADNQAHSDLLDAISLLPDTAGAIELLGGGDVSVRGIDSTDDACLISRGQADLRYAAISGASTPNPLTFSAAGAGAAPGSTFNGGTAVTISYNSLGAAASVHTHASTDITGLGYFATGTDAANLTGTIAAARIADGSLSIAKTLGLQAALDAKLGILDDTANWGAGFWRSSVLGLSIGDNASVGTVTVYSGPAGSTGGINFDKPGFAGGASIGGVTANNRLEVATYGTITGYEFDQSPYVGANVIYHAGNLNLTGDVTSSGLATTIANDAVTNAKLANMAQATFKGRAAGAGTGDPVDLTAAQAKTVLAIVAADVSLAALTDKQVLYNNAGAIAGAGGVDIDADGHLRCDDASSLTNPGADQLTFAPQRVAASGGLVMPRFLSEDGIKWTMQPHFGRNTVCGEFGVGNSSAGLTVFNTVGLTNAGTNTARTVATTNRLTRAKRVAFVSSAVAGNQAGRYGVAANVQWTVGGVSGGGFRAVFRWGCSDAAAVAGANMIVGMRSSTAAPSATTNPNTLTNIIAVAQCNGSTNLFLVYGGSAAQTAIDLGASFPAADTTALYELTLYARPDDATKVAYRVENISTGAVASGVLTGTAGTAIPANTTLLGPIMWRANNATALAVGIDIVNWMIESDI